MFLAFLQTTQIANICINGVFVQVKVLASKVVEGVSKLGRNVSIFGLWI